MTPLEKPAGRQAFPGDRLVVSERRRQYVSAPRASVCVILKGVGYGSIIEAGGSNYAQATCSQAYLVAYCK